MLAQQAREALNNLQVGEAKPQRVVLLVTFVLPVRSVCRAGVTHRTIELWMSFHVARCGSKCVRHTVAISVPREEGRRCEWESDSIDTKRAQVGDTIE